MTALEQYHQHLQGDIEHESSCVSFPAWREAAAGGDARDAQSASRKGRNLPVLLIGAAPARTTSVGQARNYQERKDEKAR